MSASILHHMSYCKAHREGERSRWGGPRERKEPAVGRACCATMSPANRPSGRSPSRRRASSGPGRSVLGAWEGVRAEAMTAGGEEGAATSTRAPRRRPSGRLDSRPFDAGTVEGEGGAAMPITGHARGEGPREEHASRSSRGRSKEAAGEGGRKT